MQLKLDHLCRYTLYFEQTKYSASRINIEYNTAYISVNAKLHTNKASTSFSFTQCETFHAHKYSSIPNRLYGLYSRNSSSQVIRYNFVLCY
jgi:hypothetical protein